jgi:ABC-type glutathione transport system ATPase component
MDDPASMTQPDRLPEPPGPNGAAPGPGSGSNLLELRHVGKTFGGGLFDRRRVTALEDFSLLVRDEQPTVTAVVGESGSGKTTMARLMLGLETPTGGQVLYRGRDLRRLSGATWREYRREVQAIFQDPFGVYNSFYKVDRVLARPIARFRLAGSRAEARRMMEQALRAVGLRPEDTLGRYPHQLSGGQRQRTMVARALVLRPRLIVADEPVSMIDASLRVTVLASLLQLKRRFGISLVYITHDLTTAYQISDRIVVLYRGRMVESGAPEQVVRYPEHPYTKLLISSIPQPDPARSWADMDVEEGYDLTPL